MIKILGLILTISGGIGLAMGILSYIKNIAIGTSSWILITLGIIFFFTGIGLLQFERRTYQIQ